MPSPLVTDIQIRFGDTDMLGHINNAAYVQYLEVARMQMVQEARKRGIPNFNFVLAHISLDFRREIKLGQQVQVETTVVKIGKSSFEMAYQVLADGVVCSTAKSVQVGIDPQAMTSAVLPDAVRGFLTSLMDPQEEV
ncbi:acyl-CoA thioesterase [Deinococcus roseus]|uniref:Thioesterase n=1 Tax=Deinococcus roseus TaxID=392414 RepID=A0ABQ2D8W8_9DEIO|nr:thioesterase family protein [Deinococcus roseus]GGJ50267.1 thioesterase [Deinococcus roseus]